MPSSASPATVTLDVLPTASVGRTIGGQRVVFLGTVGGSAADGPSELAAWAAGASVSIEPQPLPMGVVGEVTVVPAPVDRDTDLDVTISARRGGIEARVHRSLALSPGEDTLGPEAAQHLAPFVSWLAAEHRELGIDQHTTWRTTPGSWVLGVSHYLYFSDEWEVGLAWNVMIPPDDWARIDLRHRWTEVRPSMAFEIPSVAGGLPPREIPAPDNVWR